MLAGVPLSFLSFLLLRHLSVLRGSQLVAFAEQTVEVAAVAKAGEVGYQGDGIACGGQQVGGIGEAVMVQEVGEAHAVAALADSIGHIFVVRA